MAKGRQATPLKLGQDRLRSKPMGSTSNTAGASIAQVAREVGDYSLDAYHFLREGLEYAAQTIHGPITPAQYEVARYMAEKSIDFAEVIERLENGTLPPEVAAAVHRSGDTMDLNRNISGADLCWALRDFALRRWGTLADVVLHQWGVRSTLDFGRIVYALVDHGFMQKEPHDRLSDFDAVYDFSESFRSTDVLDDPTDA